MIDYYHYSIENVFCVYNRYYEPTIKSLNINNTDEVLMYSVCVSVLVYQQESILCFEED